MNVPTTSDRELDQRVVGRLLDVLIRAGLILALTLVCYQVFSPFIVLMEWAVILAVTLYPMHQGLARRMGGSEGWAATLITLIGIALIVAPAAVLVNSVGDSLHRLIDGLQQNTLEIPPPKASVADWPVVGDKIYAAWEKAHEDLPALVKSLQPKLGDLAKTAVATVAGIGGDILKFVGAFIVAGILMVFGRNGHRTSRAIFTRIAGPDRGEEFTVLSVATIRAVAQGVVGIAFIQAVAIGLCLVVAKVPLAGVLAGVVLVLGIAQVPALIITLPVIAYIWSIGTYGNVEAIVYSVLLFIAGMLDNVLKPLMLGRGVDVPMPVVLFGALGGMATSGIIGLFVGATVLSLGYKVFMSWVYGPDIKRAESGGATPPAD